MPFGIGNLNGNFLCCDCFGYRMSVITQVNVTFAGYSAVLSSDAATVYIPKCCATPIVGVFGGFDEPPGFQDNGCGQYGSTQVICRARFGATISCDYDKYVGGVFDSTITGSKSLLVGLFLVNDLPGTSPTVDNHLWLGAGVSYSVNDGGLKGSGTKGTLELGVNDNVFTGSPYTVTLAKVGECGYTGSGAIGCHVHAGGTAEVEFV